jgi:hypothetical protein
MCIQCNFWSQSQPTPLTTPIRRRIENGPALGGGFTAAGDSRWSPVTGLWTHPWPCRAWAHLPHGLRHRSIDSGFREEAAPSDFVEAGDRTTFLTLLNHGVVANMSLPDLYHSSHLAMLASLRLYYCRRCGGSSQAEQRRALSVWKLVPGALSWAPLRGRLETRWERISPALPRYIGGPPLLRHPGRAPVVPLLQRPCRDPGKEGLRAGRGIVGRRRAGRESRPSGRGSDRKTRGERKEVGMLNTAAAFFFCLTNGTGV